MIPLGSADDEFEDALQEHFRGGIDVVLDYLWKKVLSGLSSREQRQERKRYPSVSPYRFRERPKYYAARRSASNPARRIGHCNENRSALGN
jgi:hypothetical protein